MLFAAVVPWGGWEYGGEGAGAWEKRAGVLGSGRVVRLGLFEDLFGFGRLRNRTAQP